MPSDPEARPSPGDRRFPDVPGYELTEFVSGTSAEVTFRGRERTTGAPVLVEMFRAKWPSERELAARRHAYEIGTSLKGLPGVVEPVGLVATESDLALVTVDPGTAPLGQWMGAPNGSTLADRVRVAAGLAETVAQVHGRGVVHNSVAPAWFHVQPGDGAASIRGFSRATRLRSEAAEAAAPGASLHYMSPEQTGRMNRPVDARSDLYALGVIIFQLLTGELPFPESDPLTLVHAHIARPAPSVAELDPAIPGLLAEIVAILLAKNAGDRYATARGLAFDLRRVGDLLVAEADPAFELRQHDIADELVLPEGLYGRRPELDRLDQTFEAVAGGQRRALFVAGYSGIGKSQLVNELQPAIVGRSAWFGRGKFDLYRRDLPYLAWTGAVADLVRQALTLPEEALEALRTDLQTRLGRNAAALTEVVPELTALVGDQPSLPEASPAEAQARIDQAFRHLVRTFATPDSPLVLFVDDLQWSDLPSLRLLEAVLSDRSASHLLVLGAWRDNEVGPDHPLQATLRHLQEAEVRHEVLELGPLPSDAIVAYLADTVHQPPEGTASLAALVEDKTGGNPFFMRQFLEEIHRDGLLGFDSDRSAWTWDLAGAESRQITDNVADLLARRVSTLGESVRHVLSLASCIGSSFALSSVAAIAGIDRVETARALDRALAENLILPLDDSYRYAAAEAAAGSAVDTGYAFAHDRVHEAAHDSLESGERARVHLALARQLLALSEGGDLGERSVVIGSHLGEAMDLLIEPEERLVAADTFLQAGRRAKAAMATAAAAGFLEQGLALLPGGAWADHYDLTLALNTEAADVAYIDQRFDQVDRFAPEVLKHATTALDRVPIHTIRIGVGVARRAYRDATVYALEVLEEEFGIRLPKDPGQADVARGVARVKLALRGRTTSELLELSAMESPELQAAMGILMKTATNAYWATPNLVPLIAFEMCRLSVRHGNIGLSAYGYALYGMIQSAALGQVNAGYDYGRLAMDLLGRTGDTHLVGKTALLWHGFIRHTRDPLRDCGPDILEAYDVALDAGDVENAVYCGTVALFTDLLAGRSLGWVRNRYAGYIEAMLESGQDQTIGALRAWLQCLDNLEDPQRVEPQLIGEHVDFSVRLPQLEEAEAGTAIPNEVAAAGFLAFLLGDMSEAERQLGIAWDRRQDAPGQSFKTTCFALYLITLIRKRARGEATAGDRLRMVRLQRALRWRARHNPHDLEPWLGFIDAEELAAAGDPVASQRYLDAAVMAKERGFAYLEGLALDEAADQHGSRGHLEVAGQIQQTARSVWRRYGALARLRLRGEEALAAGTDGSGQPLVGGDLAGIDARTLLDTVHAVSGEIEHDRLVARVMRLALQNAGARAGVLALAVEGQLETAARATVAEDGSVDLAAVPPAEQPYPVSVVDYAVRTGEAVVLDDASTEGLFGRDPYIRARKTRSVLCVPLLRSGVLVGVLYLENDLGVGVFTEQHLAMLQAIGGQAAVSVENSRLFERQRAQAEAFAHFVPRPFLEQLNRRSIIEVALGDAVQADLAVLFSDLRAFTSLSESLTVEDNFALLNDYLAQMEPPIRKHGGFIDKFIGDAVMALFVGHPEGAVDAAVEMHAALREFNRREGAVPLQMGIGIHAGAAMLGTVGSPERMETTVIGDTVNTASRLEGMTKLYKSLVLISSEVAGQLTEPVRFALREVGRARAKGKERMTTVHEVLDARPAEELAAVKATREPFAAALRAWYEGDLVTAGRLFAECHGAAPADLLARAYAERCEQQLAVGLPDDWDGVDVRTDK